MTLSTRIAPHLPYLRRFSRAASGSQTSGDAYVAATLEALIADTSIFPEASSDRIALYKLFSRLFTSSSITVPAPTSSFAWEQRAARNLANLPAQSPPLLTCDETVLLCPAFADDKDDHAIRALPTASARHPNR